MKSKLIGLALLLSSVSAQSAENYIAYCEGCASNQMEETARQYADGKDILEGNVIVYDQKNRAAKTFFTSGYGNTAKEIKNPKEIDELVDAMRSLNEAIKNDKNNIRNKPK